MSVPRYLRQRRKGKSDSAVVRIDGRSIYLGKFGSAESLEKYRSLVFPDPPAADSPDGETKPDSTNVETSAVPTIVGTMSAVADTEQFDPSDDPTIAELIVAYLRYAETYYRDRDGKLSNEYAAIKIAMRRFRRQCGQMLAEDFGPKRLKQVREAIVAEGLTRRYVNEHVRRIVAMFCWAVSEELIEPVVHQRLATVKGLRKGRTDAKEQTPRRPVGDDVVDKTLPHVRPVVADLIQIQRYTGMRSGELLIMRPCDIDRSGEVWLYRPRYHKTDDKGKVRSIALGPKAQQVLAKYLFRGAEERMFTYSVDTYRRAIVRACDRKRLPRWSPHRLRHSAASRIRREFGLDAAQTILGHSNAKITQIYAELNEQKAAEVARKIG